MVNKSDNKNIKNNTTEEKPRPKQRAPMPKGVEFEKGNLAAFKYKEEYADMMMLYAGDDSLIYPSIEDFAMKNKIPIRTITRWVAEAKEDEEKYPRLATSHAYLLARQKQMLIDRGLCETYNSQLVKFLLSNCHGMSERTAAQVDAKTDNKFEVNIKVID